VFEFEQNDLAFSIADYVAKIQLRSVSPRGEIILTWDDSSPEITRDDVAGFLTLELLPDTTASLDFKVGYLDCLLERNDGKDGIRSATLQLTIKRGVTDGD
jgi:hypothetical protein